MFDKSKYTPRSIIVRCIVIMIGVVITAIGAALYVLAGVGSDPVTAFVQGMGHVMNKDFGTAMNYFNIAFFVVIVIIYRKVIGIGTVLYTFTLGFFSNIFINLIGSFANKESPLAVRIIMIIIGTVAIGIGLGFYQSAEFGTGPSDGFNQAMAHYTKIPLKWERMAFDAIMIVGSLIMAGFGAGFVHVGTVLGMFGVGPIMAPTITKLAPVVDQWAGTAAVKEGSQ